MELTARQKEKIKKESETWAGLLRDPGFVERWVGRDFENEDVIGRRFITLANLLFEAALEDDQYLTTDRQVEIVKSLKCITLNADNVMEWADRKINHYLCEENLETNIAIEVCKYAKEVEAAELEGEAICRGI